MGAQNAALGEALAAVTPMDGEDLGPRLEREGLLVLDVEAFRLWDDEVELARRRWGPAKNVSFDPRAGRVDGAEGEAAEMERLHALLARFSAWSRGLIAEHFAAYLAELELGRTSLRTRPVDEAPKSWRKDDRRLHVDAFTSQPVAGRRILRVFSNIDPAGEPRRWAVGEAFEDHARRFLDRTRRLLPAEAAVLKALGLTKSGRTHYDQVMLGLHDAAKGDATYQRAAPRRLVAFPVSSTWIVYTDQVPHAALGGQGALEQTFYLPVTAMHAPAASPLRTLERLTGKVLV